MTYSVVTSWLYPTESGRDICSLDFDNKQDALDYAKKLCEDEFWNFSRATRLDAFPPERAVDEEGVCYIITTKNGIDEWFFKAEPVQLTGLRIRSDVDEPQKGLKTTEEEKKALSAWRGCGWAILTIAAVAVVSWLIEKLLK